MLHGPVTQSDKTPDQGSAQRVPYLELNHESEPHAASRPSQTLGAAMLRRSCACGGTCSDCRTKMENAIPALGTLRRKATRPSRSFAPASANVAPPIVHDVIRSSGLSLDAPTRAFMEPRFGRNLGGVRIHTDARAAESARSVNALAYTVGNNVVFSAGQYDPHSGQGKKLLAHELAHVVQQRGSVLQGKLNIGQPNDSFEREADDVANRITGSSAEPERLGMSTTPAVQRYALPTAPVAAAQVAKYQRLLQQYQAVQSELAAAEAAEIATAVEEAEVAITAATEMAAAGSTAAAVGDTALATAGVLVADDVTVTGAVDDVAIPFVLLAAAVSFGVGFVVGYSSDKIAAAWERAAQSVKKAVNLMEKATAGKQSEPLPMSVDTSQPEAVPAPYSQAAPSSSSSTSTLSTTAPTSGKCPPCPPPESRTDTKPPSVAHFDKGHDACCNDTHTHFYEYFGPGPWPACRCSKKEVRVECAGPWGPKGVPCP